MRRRLAPRLAAAGLLLSLAGCGADDEGRLGAFPEYQLPSYETVAPEPIPQRPGRGTLVLGGGGFPARATLDRIVAQAGTEPSLCLIDVANGERGASSALFRTYRGVRLLSLDVDGAGADSPATLKVLQSCSGYYFGGGNPERLSGALRPDGRDSPALAVIRDRFEHHGALVSGSSAGAMIVGPVTLCECGARSSLAALLNGKLFQAPGFAFVDGVLIDAHFFARGLLGRHLYALARNGVPVGVGIDEGTAVVVPRGGGPWEVIGQRGVAVIEAPQNATTADLRYFKLSLLSPGDRFDPVKGTFLPAPERRPIELRRADAALPVTTSDVFGPEQIPELAQRLIRSPAAEAVGTAARQSIRVTIRETDETHAYSDGAHYTIIGLSVSIER